jgi:hypothetical protein
MPDSNAGHSFFVLLFSSIAAKPFRVQGSGIRYQVSGIVILREVAESMLPFLPKSIRLCRCFLGDFNRQKVGGYFLPNKKSPLYKRGWRAKPDGGLRRAMRVRRFWAACILLALK